MVSAFFLSFALAGLTSGQVEQIGNRIYRNECSNKPEFLVHWNNGEPFASCGIGHFIWFCQEIRGTQPFQEQFPELLQFLKQNNIQIPAWIPADFSCPWKTRDEWQAHKNLQQVQELRRLLENTVALQTRFIIDRFNRKISEKKIDKNIAEKLQMLSTTPQGVFALLDFAHFKGFGDNVREQYQGFGWGLFDVIKMMQWVPAVSALSEFVTCAKKVLQRRVQLAPPERNEARWLPGWINRIERYAMEG